MKIPKIVKQIGNTGVYKRVFIEEYVLAYITSLEKSDPDFEDDLVLYGEHSEEHGNPVDMVYGCARLEARIRTDIPISEPDRILMNEIRKQYFAKYSVIGIARIQSGKERRKLYLLEGDKYVVLPGYYMFFDKNEGMQEFMVEQKRQSERIQISSIKSDKGIKHDIHEEKRASTWKTYATWALLLLLGCYALYRSVENYYATNESDSIRTIAEANPQQDSSLENAEDLLQAMEEENSQNIITVIDGSPQIGLSISDNNEDESANNEVIHNIWDTDRPNENMDATDESANLLPEETDEVPKEENNTATESQISSNQPEEKAVVAEEPSYDKYVVQYGDSLILICRYRYGTDAMVDEVCQINNITNPDSIYEGQTILLPRKE